MTSKDQMESYRTSFCLASCLLTPVKWIPWKSLTWSSLSGVGHDETGKPLHLLAQLWHTKRWAQWNQFTCRLMWCIITTTSIHILWRSPFFLHANVFRPVQSQSLLHPLHHAGMAFTLSCSYGTVLRNVDIWDMAQCSLTLGFQRSKEHIASIFTSALKMEAVCSSETLIATYKIVGRHNPKHHNSYFHRQENKNLIQLLFFFLGFYAINRLLGICLLLTLVILQ